jgi:hypothetical protein
MAIKLWRFFTSINLTIWLLFAITLNLAVGSRYAHQWPQIYGQLNVQRFQEWLTGIESQHSWWVWTLFALLTLFALNTATCTADRIYSLYTRRKEFTPRAFAVVIAPSLMHLCFLVIIGGHAVSQFAAHIVELPVSTAARITAPAATIAITDSSCTFHREPGLAGLPRQCSASLSLTNSDGTTQTETIQVLHPLLWQGYSLHLTLAGKTSRAETPQLNLVVKNDPGLPLIIFGNGLLCLLMLGYFPIILRNRNGGQQCTNKP